MALQVWETLKEAITAYTGLSPPTFFTVVAVGLLTYYLLSTFQTTSSSSSSSYSDLDVEPLPPPVQVGEITEEELRLYDGSDPKKPLLMAIKAQIYDVSQSRGFYGPGGPYALFAGRDASRALAKMSFDEKDLTSDITGLGIFELEALQTWEYKFMSKYVKVGTVKKTAPESEETQNGEPSQSAAAEMSNLTKSVELSPSAVEAAEPEGGLPVKGDPENTNGDKDHTGSNSINGAVKTE